MIQFQENARTDGKTDGRTDRPDFIGPFRLPAEVKLSVSSNSGASESFQKSFSLKVYKY